jgi:hypothetical protein
MNRLPPAALLLACQFFSLTGHSQTNTKSLEYTLTRGGPLTVSDTIPVVAMTNSIEKRFKRLGKAAIPNQY